ncbi:MAG TPA: ABC transporter permease [Vicinamibacterales bacterium]|nr:ABC transporter permease [Vicinamibacterales bacterium]
MTRNSRRVATKLRPPRLARALLVWSWPPNRRDEIVRDLDEEFQAYVSQERSRFGSRKWYWSQVCRSIPAALGARQRYRIRRQHMESSMAQQPILEELRQDISWAIRSFRRAPGLTVAAAATLALGIGANTAVFSVVQAVMLRSLPYPDADRLVRIWSANPRGIPQNSMSPADFHDLAEQTGTVFTAIGGYVSGDSFGMSFGTAGDGAPRRVLGATVTPSLFDVFGVPPAAGRTLIASDATGDGASVMLLSDGFWRRHFGANPAVVGQTLNVNGTAFTIVGVMPPGFSFPDPETEIWVPLGESWRTVSRSAHFLDVVARLAPGASLAEASARLDAAAAGLAALYPETNTGWGTTVMPYYDSLVGDARGPLLILLAAVSCVLLIACANVANLLLSHGVGRSREFAVRLAIGAGRGRLLRQVLTEGVLLGLAGGAAGLALGWLALGGLLSAITTDMPRLGEVSLDGRVLAVTTAVSIGVGLLSSLGPAFRAAATPPQVTLQVAAPAGSKRTRRLRETLLVAETALMVALLVAAGLLIRTLGTVNRIPPGFRADNVLLGNVSLPGARYDQAGRAAFFERALGSLARLPGVTTAAAGGPLPLSGSEGLARFGLLVESRTPDTDRNRAYLRRATPGYFEAMGIPLRLGRPFGPSDRPESVPVAIVDEELVRRQFPNENPLGKRVRPSNSRTWREIVGVVGAVRQTSLLRPADPHLYLPQSQMPTSTLTFVLRVDGDPDALRRPLEAAIGNLDPELPVYDVRTLKDLHHGATAAERTNALLLGVFAGLAGLLTLIGIHSVVRYFVSESMRELGVRLALGARPGQVLAFVVRRNLRLQLVGLAAGICLAWVGARWISGALYGVTPVDPATYLATSALVLAAGTAAAWLPARRALRIDPIESLR